MTDPQAVPAPETANVGRGRPTPKAVLERRLVFVATAWQRGVPNYQLKAAIAKAQADEASKWKQYRAGVLSEAPLLIWGEYPVGERTIEGYIARVVKAHEVEGNELSKRAAQFMGKHLARLEAGFASALAENEGKGNGLLALRYLREIGKFLGINAAVEMKIGGLDSGEPIKTQEIPPMAPLTEDAVINIASEIAARARNRLAEQKRIVG